MTNIKQIEERVQKYFNTTAFSHSFAKAVEGGSSQIRKYEEQGEEHYDEFGDGKLLGSALDTWITFGKEYFHSKYRIVQIDKPSDSIQKIVRDLIDSDYDDWDKIDNTTLSNFCVKHDYYAKDSYKVETRVKKLVEGRGRKYFDSIINNKDYICLDLDQWDKLQKAYKLYSEHPWSIDFFNAENIQLQVPLYCNILNIDCKGLLDRVDKKNRTIRIIDFKYTENNPKFAYYKFKYYRQVSWYKKLYEKIHLDKEGNKECWIAFFNPFLSYPVFVKVTYDGFLKGLFGETKEGETAEGYRYYEELKQLGMYQLLDKYKHFLETNQWEIDPYIYENKGQIIYDI